MNLLGTILKRVERRFLREAENAATKKIKGLLFGEKVEKIELVPWVEYSRTQIKLQDWVAWGQRKGLSPEEKKAGELLIRSFKETYGKLLEEEKGLGYSELLDRAEQLL